MLLNFARKHFSLLTVLCVAAVFISLVPASGSAEKEIPITKFSQNVGGYGATMTFLYCYSCGYRKAFDEYYNIIHEKYPEITIRGGNYEPHGFYMYFSKILLVTKLLVIITLISNFDLFGFLKRPMPSWWRWCTENKLYACMMIFFLGNMIEAQLMSSGAFEISLNDVPVWSKLETGRIPAPQELFQIIDSHLQFSDKIEQNPDFVK